MATDRFNGVVASKAIKVPCVVVTSVNITLEGNQVIDGVTVNSDDRVLVAAQTNAVENGIYDVKDSAWDRAADWDGNRDVTHGTLVGAYDSLGDFTLYIVDTDEPITIGSTAVSIIFYLAGSAAILLAGTITNAMLRWDGVDTWEEVGRIQATVDGAEFRIFETTLTDYLEITYVGTSAIFSLSNGAHSIEIQNNITVTGSDVFITAGDITVAGTAQSERLIAGDPGTEGTGITIGGVTYESSAKISDLGGTNLAQMILHRHSTTIGAVLVGSRSNTDDDTHALVTDGQALLWLIGVGHDGVDYEQAGSIQIDVDGTAASNDMPGRIVFSTTPAGGVTPVEAMRIRSTGDVEMDFRLLLPSVNDPAAPTLAFGVDSGFYEVADNSIGISLNGARAWFYNSVHFRADSSTGAWMLLGGATATAPGFGPRSNDLDTGVGSGTADTLSLIGGGFELMRLTEDTENKIDAYVPIFITEQTTANATEAGKGQFWVRDDVAPNVPMFTDDDGNDFVLNEGGNAAIEFIINADINTATPPTTETVTARLVYRDLADDDQLGFIGYDGGHDLEIINDMRGGEFLVQCTDTAGIKRTFLDYSPQSAAFIRADQNMAMYVNNTVEFLNALASTGQVILNFGGVNVANSRTTADGGWFVDNDYNGGATFERVLTENDMQQGLNVMMHNFSTGIGAGDPGGGGCNLNNATMSSVTIIRFDDVGRDGINQEWLYPNIVAGDLLTLHSETITSDYVIFRATGVAVDQTGWWEVPVEYVAGIRPANSSNLRTTWQQLGEASGSGAGISGTPVDNQIAVWTGATDIEGDAGLTWDGAILQISTIGGNQLDLHDNNSTGAASASSIIFTDDLDATQGTIGMLPVFNVLLVSSANGDVLISANSGAGDVDIDGDLEVIGGELRITDADVSDFLTIVNDGTDTNFTITGGGEMDFADHVMRQMILKDYSIAQVDYVPSGTTQALVYADGPAFTVDLESASGNMTLSITGGPAASSYGQVTVRVQQDGATPRTVTWGGGDTYRHVDDTAHPMNTTLDGITVYTLETFDAGASWEVSGANYGP
jgi:hypothetical protein